MSERQIVIGCVNVKHNALDCFHSHLPPVEWCSECLRERRKRILADRETTAARPEPGFHICTCGDCDSEAFTDRCKFEVALRALVDNATEYHSAHVVSSELIATSKSLLESDRG